MNPFFNNFNPPGTAFLTSIEWYNFLSIIPLISFNGRDPLELMAPQRRIDPPPNFIVGERQNDRKRSPLKRRTKTRRRAPNNSILVSSVQRTLLHCSVVQLTYFFANASLFLTFFVPSNGFFAATLPTKPHSINALRTVLTETGLWRPQLNSSLNWMAVFLFFGGGKNEVSWYRTAGVDRFRWRRKIHNP